MNEQGHRNKTWKTSKGKLHEGTLFKPDTIYRILKSQLYVGRLLPILIANSIICK